MKYLYLHGLGQNADSWNKVTSATEVSENSACLDLAEMIIFRSLLCFFRNV